MKQARQAKLVLLGLLLTAGILNAQNPDAERFWAQWRGPYGTGVSQHADPPMEWSETKNIRWKVEIPGRGNASPVVWNDRIFLTTAVPAGVEGPAQHEPRGGLRPRGMHRFVVLSINRSDGKILWERTVREQEPHEAGHTDNSTWASGSAVTDGQNVFAYFESFGLYAFDMDGKLLWEKDLGDKRMRNQFGEGSTPALYRNRLVIVWDHLSGKSFVTVLDKNTGQEIWRADRDEIDTWATPLVLEHDGRAQAIVPGMKRLRSYDLETGAIIWESDGLTMNPIPSPVAAEGMVIAMSGFQGNDLKAIRLSEARGNIDGTSAIVWSLDRDTPYVPSPLLYGGILYFLKTNNGILSAFEPSARRDGEDSERSHRRAHEFRRPLAQILRRTVE